MKLITPTKNAVLALTIMTLLNPFAAAARDPLLEMIPSDIVFCVRINQFNTSLGALDQYLMGASPVPVSMAMLANFQLAAMVGDPELAGIDQNGTFMAVGIALEDGIDMTIIAPMTDYEAFVKNNPHCTPSGNPEVTLLAAPNSPAGKMVMVPAPGGKYALVNSEDNLSAMLTLQRQLTEKTTRLAAALDAEQTAQAASAPAWIYVNMARLNELYGRMLTEMIDEMSQQTPPEMGMGAGAMEINFQVLKGMVKEGFGQANAMTLAVTPEPSVLNLDLVFRAKDGSKLASALVADPQTPKAFSLAGYSNDAAAVNAVVKTNRILAQKMSDVIVEFMKESFAQTLTAENIEQFKSLIEKSLAASGDEMFVSYAYGPGQPPFMFRQVQQTTDPAFFRNTASLGTAAINNLYKAMELPFVFSYQQDVDNYKNIPIDAWTLSFPADANDPAAAVIAQMYGKDGLTYYGAQKDTLGFIALGPNGKDDIKALLDTPANKPAAGELQKALTILGPTAQQADMVGSINILKLAKGGLEMARQMGEPVNQMLSPVAAAMNIQTQSCMAASVTVANGKIAARLALPKQHLMEIATTAMQIQMQMMQQPQNIGMMGGASAQPQPASPFPPQPTQASARPKDPLQDWIGKPAPDVKMKDIQGNAISIADLKGKKIVLDFWATWCPPCKEMIPDFVKLRTEHSVDELAILGVSNEPIDRLNKFAKDYKMNYPVISHTAPLPTPYDKVVGIPTTFFIDSAGIIRHVLVGYHDLSEIQTALDSMQ